MNPAEDYWRGLGKTFEEVSYHVHVWDAHSGTWSRDLTTSDWQQAYDRYNYNVEQGRLVRVIRRVSTTIYDLEMHTGEDVRVDFKEHSRRAGLDKSSNYDTLDS